MRSGTEELRCSLLTSLARGAVGLKGTGCLEDILIYTIALCMVSTWGFLAYLRHMFRLITHLFTNFLENMKKLWIRNFKKEDTSVLSPGQISSPSLGLFSLPPYPLFPNWESQESSAQYTTSPTCVKHPQIRYHLSTPRTFLAPGECSPQYALSFIDYPQAPRPPSEMSLKHIEPYQYDMINGQVWLYDFMKKTALQPTYATTSVSHQQEEHTASSQMPVQTFSKLTASAHCLNGLMTIYSFESPTSTSMHTTTSASPGISWSPLMEDESTKVAVYGTKVRPCPTDAPRSLMKTWPAPCRIYLVPQNIPKKTPYSPMRMTTLTASQMSSASHGKRPKPFHSDQRSLTLASYGILTCARWPSQWRRSSSTSMQLRNGKGSQGTPWLRYKSYMVSYSMLPWSFPPDARTLPILKPCFQDSIVVLSCHTPHPAAHLRTLGGGQDASDQPPSQGVSPVQYPLWIVTPTPMQAQASASASRLETGGALGTCSQAGNPMGVTLDGPKPLASSSSPSSSYHPATTALTSRFTETTKGWLKDGGKGAVETSRQISSSGAFTMSLKLGNTPYTPDTSPVNKTQQTSHPDAFTHLLHASCPVYPSPQNFTASSSTLILSFPLQTLIKASHQPPCPSPTASSQKTSAPPSTLTLTIRGRNSSPAPPTSSQEHCLWNTLLPASLSEK